VWEGPPGGVDFDALDGKVTHLFFVLGLKFSRIASAVAGEALADVSLEQKRRRHCLKRGCRGESSKFSAELRETCFPFSKRGDRIMKEANGSEQLTPLALG